MKTTDIYVAGAETKRKCSKCGTVKTLNIDNFEKNKQCRGGFAGVCRACRKKQNNERYKRKHLEDKRAGLEPAPTIAPASTDTTQRSAPNQEQGIFPCKRILSGDDFVTGDVISADTEKLFCQAILMEGVDCVNRVLGRYIQLRDGAKII